MLAAIVDDMLIHLVHDGVNIVADAKLGNDLELFLGEDLAAGVRGVADDDGLCTAAEGVLQYVRVEGERRRVQGDKDRHDGLGTVIFKKRGEHHNAVARIGQGEERVDHGFGRTDGGDDLGLRVNGAAHEMAALARDGLTEVRRTHRDGVLVGAFVADHLKAIRHLLGRVKIGEALRQVDRAALIGDACHSANDGIGKMLVSAAHLLHRGTVLSVAAGAEHARRAAIKSSNSYTIRGGEIVKYCAKPYGKVWRFAVIEREHIARFCIEWSRRTPGEGGEAWFRIRRRARRPARGAAWGCVHWRWGSAFLSRLFFQLGR